MNQFDYNPLGSLFPEVKFPEPEYTERSPSVVTIEDDGFYLHVSTGDDGLTLTPEEAEAVVAKLGFALQERSYES